MISCFVGCGQDGANLDDATEVPVTSAGLESSADSIQVGSTWRYSATQLVTSNGLEHKQELRFVAVCDETKAIDGEDRYHISWYRQSSAQPVAQYWLQMHEAGVVVDSAAASLSQPAIFVLPFSLEADGESTSEFPLSFFGQEQQLALSVAVEAKSDEEVSVPAGAYTCVRASGNISIAEIGEVAATVWFDPQIGPVKIENRLDLSAAEFVLNLELQSFGVEELSDAIPTGSEALGKVEEIVIEDFKAEKNIDGAGKKIIVNGAQNTLKITGSVVAIEVNGSQNSILVDSSRTIKVEGSRNRVLWKGKAGANEPVVEVGGVNNEVAQGESLDD